MIINKFSSFYKIEGYGNRANYLKMKLSTINYRTDEVIGMGYCEDDEKRILRVPAGMNEVKLKKYLNAENHDIKKTGIAIPFDAKLNISFNAKPKDYQKKIIDKIVTHYKRSGTQALCDAKTGTGKTFMAVGITTKLKCNTMILLKQRDKLAKQWMGEYLDLTTLKYNQVRIVDGTSDMMRLGEYSHEARIFIITHCTIREYIKRFGWQKLNEWMMYNDIGLRIYDEADQETSNMISLDCHTPVRHSLYLTATPYKSSKNDDLVYKEIMEDVLKTGSEHFNDVPDRACEIVHIKSNPTPRQYRKFCYKKAMRDSQGNYIGKKREEFIKFDWLSFVMKTPEWLNALDYIVEEKVLPVLEEKNEKSILYMASIKGCDELKKILTKRYHIKPKDIGVYHSKIDKSKKAREGSKPIIVTTQKSLGRGVDIKGIKYTSMVGDVMGSNSMGAQLYGRTSRIGGVKGYHTEIVDNSINAIIKMYQKRVKEIEKEFSEIKITRMY